MIKLAQMSNSERVSPALLEKRGAHTKKKKKKIHALPSGTPKKK